MGWQQTVEAGQVYPIAGGERGRMLAADADRDHITDMLGTAYCEGRLSGDEYEARLDAAVFARTYADLDELVSDLPDAPPAPVTLRWPRWPRPAGRR